MAAAVHHRLVICEGPGHLSIAGIDRPGEPSRRPLATKGLWPCWSPDGELIALSSLDTTGREVRGSIELIDAAGVAIRTAHTSIPGAPPVIAPRVPHYVNWSPDGSILSFVAPGVDALGLYLSDREGAYSSDRIATGAPLFSAWSPDSRYVAIHAGAELSLYDRATRTARAITSNAVGFRTPAFAAARLVFTRPSPPGVVLLAAAVDDPDDVREVARFDGGTVLQPVGGHADQVSVCLTREPDSGNFDELLLVSIPGGEVERVAKGPFSAALWSPDGRQAAVVIPTQTGDGRYAIQVYARSGRYTAACEAFVPSQDFRMYLGFFDQYAHSHRLWAPDGSAFALAGRLPGDAIAWSFADRHDDYVWYWPTRPGEPLRRLGTGDCAFFSPVMDGNNG